MFHNLYINYNFYNIQQLFLKKHIKVYRVSGKINLTKLQNGTKIK